MESSFYKGRDGWLFLIGLTALCVEATYLAQQMRWIETPTFFRMQQSGLRHIGTVVETKQNVKNRSTSSLSWYPVSTGDALHLNDTLMTMKDSWAKVKLEGEGEIWIEPNSLISLSERKDEKSQPTIVLQVNQGAVKVKTDRQVVRVRLKKKDIEVQKDSALVVSRSVLSEEGRVQVTEGRAEIKDGSETKAVASLSKGEVLEIRQAPVEKQDAPEEKIVVREPAFVPVVPSARQEFFLNGPHKKTDFRWDGDAADTLELSTTSDFKNPKSISVKGNDAQIEVEKGHFYWRVKSGKTAGPVQEFINYPAIQYELVEPKASAAKIKTKPIRFHWKSIENASNYRFELSRDANFGSVFYTKDLSNTELVLRMKPGKYFWRVRGKYESFGFWPASSPEAFLVTEPLKPPKPKGFKILEESSRNNSLLEKIFDWVIPSAHAEVKKKQLKFEWDEISGSKKYQFELSESSDFSTVFQVELTSSPGLTVAVDPEKTWYWRVAGIDAQGERGEYCEVQTIVIPKEKPKPPPVIVIEAPPKQKSVHTTFVPWAYEFRAGSLASFHSETAQGAGFSAKTSGLQWLHPHGQISFIHPSGRVYDFSVGYQPIKYESEDGNISAFQGTLSNKMIEAELLTHGLFDVLNYPASIGIRGGIMPVFNRTGNESLELKQSVFAELLFGTSFRPKPSRGISTRTEALAYFGPIGDRKTIGLRGRLGISHRGFSKAFFPELYLSANLARTSMTGASSAGLQLEMIVGAIVGWRID